MTDPLATGPLGISLLSFERVPEETRFGDFPVGYALVALWHRGRVLLVHVRGRDSWELPGGGIEAGETPRQAAARELREETDQVLPAAALQFAGFAKTTLPNRKTLYGALYTAEIAEPGPFAPNDEIAAVHWWDGQESLPGGVLQTTDSYLAALTRTS